MKYILCGVAGSNLVMDLVLLPATILWLFDIISKNSMQIIAIAWVLAVLSAAILPVLSYLIKDN